MAKDAKKTGEQLIADSKNAKTPQEKAEALEALCDRLHQITQDRANKK